MTESARQSSPACPSRVRHALRRVCSVAAVGVVAMAVSAAGTAVPAQENHQVEMLNKGPDGERMVFVPAYLHVQPGDSVTFVPVDRSHNSESILGMIPDAADAWKGKINEEITVTFEEEGVYGYKCLPHYGLGMIGLIQVGEETPNLDEAQNVRLPGRAAGRMALLFEQVTAGE